MRNGGLVNHLRVEAQIHEAKSVQMPVKAEKVGGFLLRVLIAALGVPISTLVERVN